MTSLVKARIKKAQKMMADFGIDLLFVNNRENLIYFTGITQIECLVILIPRQGEACAATLWLDAAYVQQESGLTTDGYHFPQGSLVDKCIERIKAYGFTAPCVGFERYFVGFPIYDGLRQAGRIVAPGMDAAVKTVRPSVNEIDILAEAEYAMLKAGSDGSPLQAPSGVR